VTDLRRRIPSVDRLLGSAPFARLLAEAPRDLVVARLQDEIAGLRRSLADAHGAPHGTMHGAAVPVDDPAWYAERVARSIRRLSDGSLRAVLNATGVVLHTNLGRAPLAVAAVEAIRHVASGYATLEYDLATGGRGSRYVHCRDLLVHLTGAEDALVVNNNAAALVLALNTVSRDLETVISRGELVEIGGAFRVPEIIGRSGARLREVGSTNRTRPEDYRHALSQRTGALLKVHPSNFTIEGYTAEASVAELVSVAREGGVPLIHDLGSGLLLDPALLGLPPEPTPQESLRSGADVVTLSGDKLLGGPQCGIIAGDARLLERMRRNPLCRAMRVDKLTLAALAATLRLYLEPARALHEVPVLRMLRCTPGELEQRALRLAARLDAAGVAATTQPGRSAVGGGAAPAAVLPTTLLLLPAGAVPAQELERRLRNGEPPVIARIVEDRVALDLRTIAPDAESLLLHAVQLAASAA
jgi:L-seryl-tRNA(Ser) seleniumtransferase